MRTYLKSGSVPPNEKGKHTFRLKDGRTFDVGHDEEGYHLSLAQHRFELSPPLPNEILNATAFFTFYHSGYASRPTARELPDTGVFEYKTAKAVLQAINGGGYAMTMRFERYDDGKALFMAIWHHGVNTLPGIILPSQALAA